jgi:hypothetical protein
MLTYLQGIQDQVKKLTPQLKAGEHVGEYCMDALELAKPLVHGGQYPQELTLAVIDRVLTAGGDAGHAGCATQVHSSLLPENNWQPASQTPDSSAAPRQFGSSANALIQMDGPVNHSKNSKENSVKCFNCGEAGHYSCNCPKAQKDRQNGGRSSRLSMH